MFWKLEDKWLRSEPNTGVDFGVYRNLYELSAMEDFVGASLWV